MQGTIAFLCAVFLGSVAQADAFSDSRGIWMRDDGNAKVSIAPCGQQLCATNLWIGDTSKGEQAGDKLIMTLRPASQGTLAGKAYDPKRDRTYSMTLTVRKGGLTTRGCIGAGLICKNVRWTPAK
ncbi:hypothetical protein MesoLj113a_64770 [Mesorhizobium sp. 113-1-2]|uniref:DUF2147 domain-containing protein n=1 Tax=Mesorhizobium sp. 113-1-2 TaxID=2744515 RepID=UPI0008199180|nr:DUF2147 domain-containing protein [Mesorhizobium sp. 113-1-2]BAV51003.1 hypothetical protein MLTONO_6101 [Mesorhizobium loti]BCG75319.1 hypothetical protein MesoLj113a_64770 [Mesorhizobium sp. 113-1-2]